MPSGQNLSDQTFLGKVEGAYRIHIADRFIIIIFAMSNLKRDNSAETGDERKRHSESIEHIGDFLHIAGMRCASQSITPGYTFKRFNDLVAPEVFIAVVADFFGNKIG